MKILRLGVIADTLLARAARPFRCSSNQNLKNGKLAGLFLSAPFFLCAVVPAYGENASTDAEISELKARIERLEEEKAEAGSAAELPEWLKSIEIHSFLSVGYVWNFNEPDSNINTQRLFDFRHNAFRADDFQFSVLRPAKDPGEVGFRFDLDVGSNIPRNIHSVGLFENDVDPVTGEVDFEDIDLRQAFVSYNAPLGNGLTIDFGKYITHFGLEVIEGWQGFNDNYSRSYDFSFAAPFTHTGIRVSYPISKQLSVMATVNNGWDQVDDVNDMKSFGGQIGFFPMDGVSLYFNYLGGPEQPDNDNDWRHLFGLVWVVKPLPTVLPDLTFSGGYDYGMEEDFDFPDGSVANVEWQAVEGILRYDFTPWFYLAFRGEWMDDDDGTRIPGGVAQNVWAFTLTPTFKIKEHLVIRPEVRYDNSNKAVFEKDGGDFRDHQTTIGVNAIYYF